MAEFRGRTFSDCDMMEQDEDDELIRFFSSPTDAESRPSIRLTTDRFIIFRKNIAKSIGFSLAKVDTKKNPQFNTEEGRFSCFHSIDRSKIDDNDSNLR